MPRDAVLLAFSGGVGAQHALLAARREHRLEVATLFVDTGGHGPREALSQRNRATGACRALWHEHADASDDAYTHFFRYLLLGRLPLERFAPAAAAAGRFLIAKRLVTLARERGLGAVAYGGEGQAVRQLALALRLFGPELEVLDPVAVEPDETRARRVAVLAQHLPEALDRQQRQFGSDVQLWGTAAFVAAPLPESRPPLEAALPEAPGGPPPKPRVLRLAFRDGHPTALDGRSLAAPALLGQLAEAGRAQRLGRRTWLCADPADRRGLLAYEHPAYALAARALAALAAHAQSRAQQELAEELGRRYAALLEEGRYYDPVMRDLEAALEAQAAALEGEVRLRLSAGQLEVLTVEAARDLAAADLHQAGGKGGAWIAADDVAAARLAGLSAQLVRRFLAGPPSATGQRPPPAP